MRATAVFLLLSLTILPAAAIADEQMTPLAISGDWAAFEHRESMEDPPDFCFAAEVVDHFAIRADNDDIEIRYSNDAWSLPAGVSGQIKLSINGDTYPLDISNNTNTMVIAVVTEDQLEKIVADMNKAGSMTVSAGNSAPVNVSLSGSNQAITAFLTCANISQPGNTGGSNPFGNSGSGNSNQ